MRLKCSCGKMIKVPDELLGKKVRCPACKTVLLAREEPATEVSEEQEPRSEPKRPGRKKETRQPQPSFLSKYGLFLGIGVIVIAAGVVAAFLLLRNLGDDKDPTKGGSLANNSANPAKPKEWDGDWELIRTVSEDATIPKVDSANVVLTILGDTFTLKLNGVVQGKSEVKVNEASTPKTMDETGTQGETKGKTALSIYELKGDQLLICTAPEGKARPTEFSCKPGSGHSLETYKRLKK